jgi:hypothetical protein
VYRANKPENPRVFSFKAVSDVILREWVEALERSRRLAADLGLQLRAAPAAAAAAKAPAKQLHGMPTHRDYLLKQNPKGLWQKRWCPPPAPPPHRARGARCP